MEVSSNLYRKFYGILKSNEYIDFYSLIDFICAINQFNGINFYNKKTNIYKTITLGCLGALFFAFALNGSIASNNLERKMSSLHAMIAILIGFVRQLDLLKHRDQISDLILTAIDNMNMDNSEKNKHIWSKYGRGARFIIILFTVVMVSVIGFSVIVPFFMYSYHLLLFEIKIPGISSASTIGYEIHHSVVGIVFSLDLAIFLGFELLYFLMSYYIAYQCDHFTANCIKIGNENVSHKDILNDIAEEHWKIYQFTKDYSENISLVLLCQSSLTMYLLAAMLYSLTIITIGLWFYLWVFICLMHFFLFCLCGEIVKSKIEELPNSLYLSEWYNLSCINDRKAFLLIVMQSQKTISYSAYNLVEIGMELYAIILKAAFGYYTFLTNL